VIWRLGFRVGGLADVDLELLFLLLSLQLGDERFLLDDGLTSLGPRPEDPAGRTASGARSISAWKPAFLISVLLIDSAIWP